MSSFFALKLEFSASSFSLSKLRYKRKINDTHSRHVETIELPNKWKENVESQQIEKPNQKLCSKSNNKI